MSPVSEAPVLLGIETSGPLCAAAVHADASLIAEASVQLRNVHSKVLPELVTFVMARAGLAYSDLDAIALSRGPGSFTGLRIGYSLAKGIAHAASLPILEVDTLTVWARQAACGSRYVMPLIDARRDEVFTALYDCRSGTPLPETPAQIVPITRLAEMARSGTLICGIDAYHLMARIEGLPADVEIVAAAPPGPPLWALFQLALEQYQRGEVADVAHCEPLYIRRFKGVS